ncbi:tryptophan-rich sensory protein [Ancylobacter dichloromethanicus]|uniref:Sensory protein TspO n=1 Tax=Ancylobacter dichloromethanicus TaxID=518825 RepID=A0A9W6N0C5_9HYPH|nr:TspO/MBR family protein [Ancylobacter dichloromethanicus]MBS7553268.1 tryptophan-rich sensory protein [Ancylobacter dichloromethanicus]GLK73048.1 sensory protein TspO [Ancylobacter dichloromethanicus]
MKTLSFFRLVLAVGLCLAVGAVGSLATAPKIPTWYAALAKPAWTPPDAAFPVAWTILYVLMAVALWRLWQLHTPSPARRAAIGLWFAQLALNAVWSPVFFGMEAPGAALVVVVALWLAIAATIWACARIDRMAAVLLVPYLAWVSYATALNAAIVTLN